jgi:aryl-alcohol dehydrogenase-like predicted oxidoreductase
LADGPSVPADALKRSNKSKILKRVRISGFGVVALSGFIGGIMTNNTVKKSLDDEKALFNRYMNANANQTRVTYQEYIDQTEKTDAKMRQRTFLYVLSGLGLAACGISFKF